MLQLIATLACAIHNYQTPSNQIGIWRLDPCQKCSQLEARKVKASMAAVSFLFANRIIEPHAAFVGDMPRAVKLLQMPHRKADLVHGVS